MQATGEIRRVSKGDRRGGVDYPRRVTTEQRLADGFEMEKLLSHSHGDLAVPGPGARREASAGGTVVNGWTRRPKVQTELHEHRRRRMYTAAEGEDRSC